MLAAAAYGDGIDLAAFDLDVRRQKVIPRVHERISALPARGPDCPSRRFAREYAGNVNWSLRLVKELLAATRMLREAGIPSVPMKGVSLAQQWYGSLAARTAGDVDLLVAPEHGNKAERLFREAGYLPWENPVDPEDRLPERLRYEEAFRNPRTGVLVELHFRLNHNPNLMPLPFAGSGPRPSPSPSGGRRSASWATRTSSPTSASTAPGMSGAACNGSATWTACSGPSLTMRGPGWPRPTGWAWAAPSSRAWSSPTPCWAAPSPTRPGPGRSRWPACVTCWPMAPSTCSAASASRSGGRATRAPRRPCT
ncbi:nucleotidyltransferase family protein [Aerophototrophica crusticola]|uniref:Nucleotidyltransferase family protein n=1 Tax=Aerophototrophica crusticola TaxID=1709002 RepID=A0A858R799_9PROT|nr:nucleotidyltransferase family protein [Rhodospirillaceae bacterium B3]